jgi:hypothetical protein
MVAKEAAYHMVTRKWRGGADEVQSPRATLKDLLPSTRSNLLNFFHLPKKPISGFSH